MIYLAQVNFLFIIIIRTSSVIISFIYVARPYLCVISFLCVSQIPLLHFCRIPRYLGVNIFTNSSIIHRLGYHHWAHFWQKKDCEYISLGDPTDDCWGRKISESNKFTNFFLLLSWSDGYQTASCNKQGDTTSCILLFHLPHRSWICSCILPVCSVPLT